MHDIPIWCGTTGKYPGLLCMISRVWSLAMYTEATSVGKYQLFKWTLVPQGISTLHATHGGYLYTQKSIYACMIYIQRGVYICYVIIQKGVGWEESK